jgi:hypothetical protein
MPAVQLRVLGGAMARVPADATAFAHRKSRIMFNVSAFYATPDEAPVHEAWVTDLAAALMRQADAGAYVNFLGDEGEGRVRAAYPGDTWNRLTAIKHRHEPTNLFRLNQNFPPAGRLEHGTGTPARRVRVGGMPRSSSISGSNVRPPTGRRPSPSPRAAEDERRDDPGAPGGSAASCCPDVECAWRIAGVGGPGRCGPDFGPMATDTESAPHPPPGMCTDNSGVGSSGVSQNRTRLLDAADGT